MTHILDDLAWRYATKKFDTEQKLSDEQLETIQEALRLTPSSFGLQPWKFILIENPELRNTLKEHSWGQSQITDASHLLVLCRVEKLDQEFVDLFFNDMKETTGSKEEDIQWYKNMVSGFVENLDDTHAKIWSEKQIYIALWNIMTVLATMKIDSCPMEWFDSAKYDEVLQLKEKWLASSVILPIGFRASDDAYAHHPKVRFDTEDLFIEM